MYAVLQILSVIVVAIVLTTTLAHALELPGKMRLSKNEYLTVQPIYYPGFTIAGFAEPAGVLILLLLMFVTPGTAFWLMLGAFLALLLMHLLYWILIHPINNFWLKDIRLKGLGAGFFGSGLFGRGKASATVDWTTLRDRWEYSHAARALLAMIGLILLVTAVAL